MLNRIEFDKIINPLEESTSNLKEKQKEIYFNKLRYFTESEMRITIDYLIESYSYTSFPKIAHFFKVVRQLRLKKSQVTFEDFERQQERYCESCGGTGFILEEYIPMGFKNKYTKAIYCNCSKGQRIKEGHKILFMKRHGVQVSDVKLREFEEDDVPF